MNVGGLNRPSMSMRAGSNVCLSWDSLASMATALARTLRDAAQKNLDRGLEIGVVRSSEQARRHILVAGMPDLAWIDIRLGTGESGVELARWLRTEKSATIVIGKTASASPEEVRAMTRLGAVSVWTPDYRTGLSSLLATAARASDEATVIRRLEASADAMEQSLGPHLHGAIKRNRAIEAAMTVHRLIQGLEVELETPLPEGTGSPAHTLHAIRSAHVKQALLASHGALAEAGRDIGVTSRTVLRLGGMTRTGRRR